jgi:hypothetical protein
MLLADSFIPAVFVSEGGDAPLFMVSVPKIVFFCHNVIFPLILIYIFMI